MPVDVKEVHLASSIEELNKKADFIKAKERDKNNCGDMCRKLFKCAMDLRNEEVIDQERIYIYFFRALEMWKFFKESEQFLRDQRYYNLLFGREIKLTMRILDDLTNTLSERYKLKSESSVALIGNETLERTTEYKSIENETNAHVSEPDFGGFRDLEILDEIGSSISGSHHGDLNRPVSDALGDKATKSRAINDLLKKSTIPLEEILDILECMACFETVTGSCKICTRGHLVCGDCVNKINNKCPSCREPIADRVPICVKQLLGVVPRLCPHPGCEKLVKSSSNHEKYCKRRRFACRMGGCEERVLACDLVNHRGGFEIKRDNPGLLEWPNFNSPNETERAFYIECFDSLYSLELIKNERFLKIMFHVVYIDDADPRCCVAALEAEKNGLNFKCTLTPSITEEGADEWTPSFEVPQRYVAQFVNFNGRLSMKYEIKPKSGNQQSVI